MKKFFKGLAFWVASVAVVSATIAMSISSSTVTATVPDVIDNTPTKIDALKDEVVASVLSCESAGYKEDDAIVTYDNNQAGSLKGKNVWSFGQLQFKVSTIQHYSSLRGVTLTQKEAVLLALDTDKASDLAKYVIFDQNGIDNWHNCAVKLSLQAEVSAIQKLSK